MLKHLIIPILLAAECAQAVTWRPSERFLSAVRHVESSNGAFVVGDEGQSLGDFQISEAAWTDVNAWRKARHLPRYNYRHHVFNRKINRLYAADYFSILHAELKKKLDRPPTNAELYAAYNMGLGQFAQCKYRLTEVNPVTLKKCQQIAQLVAQRAPPELAGKVTRRADQPVSQPRKPQA